MAIFFQEDDIRPLPRVLKSTEGKHIFVIFNGQTDLDQRGAQVAAHIEHVIRNNFPDLPLIHVFQDSSTSVPGAAPGMIEYLESLRPANKEEKSMVIFATMNNVARGTNQAVIGHIFNFVCDPLAQQGYKMIYLVPDYHYLKNMRDVHSRSTWQMTVLPEGNSMVQPE